MMQWFENVFKERFFSNKLDGKDTDLDGIDSEELWAQISESIPQVQPSESSRFSKIVIVGVIPICLFILGLMFFNNISINNTTSYKSQALSTKPNNKIKVDSNNEVIDDEGEMRSILKVDNEISSHKTITNINENGNNPKPENSLKKAVENIEDITIFDNRSNSRSIETKNKVATKKYSDTTNNNKTKGLASKINLENSQKTNKLALEKSDFGNDELNIRKSTSSSNQGINNNNENNIQPNSLPIKGESPIMISKPKSEIHISKLGFNDIEKLSYEIMVPGLIPLIPMVDVIKKENPWSIKLIGQINTFDQTYNDVGNGESLANEVNQSIDSLRYGSGVGVYLGYALNRKWSMNMGIESNQYENQLNKVITTDTMLFDEVEQRIKNYKIVRNVRHTNKVSALTIPFSIGYGYHINQNVTLGMSLGISYSLVTTEDVKLFNRGNSFIDFDDLPSRHFENYISFRLNPYIRYRLTDHFELALESGIAMQSHGKSAVIDLSHKSIIYSIGLGLGYSF